MYSGLIAQTEAKKRKKMCKEMLGYIAEITEQKLAQVIVSSLEGFIQNLGTSWN